MFRICILLKVYLLLRIYTLVLLVWIHIEIIFLFRYTHTQFVIKDHQLRLWSEFLTPLMLCVLILYISNVQDVRDVQFKVEKLFTAIFSQSFCQKSVERKSPKKYISYFVLMSGLGLEPWLFVLFHYTFYINLQTSPVMFYCLLYMMSLKIFL